MTDAMDMSTPVTRGELRAEIEHLEQRLEHRFESRFATLATRADLESWSRTLMSELAQHARAIQEAISTQISVIDERDADLPARVSRLEAVVFTRKRR